MTLNRKKSHGILVKRMARIVDRPYHKGTATTVMKHGVVIGKILPRVGIAARVAYHKCLVEKQSNITLFCMLVHDMNITHKCTELCVNRIVKFHNNADLFVTCYHVANQRVVWV